MPCYALAVRLLLGTLLGVTQCIEPLSTQWTEMGPCREQRDPDCVSNLGASSWAGGYWEKSENADASVADEDKNGELTVNIAPTGGSAFLVYKQFDMLRPAVQNSVLRLEVRQIPNPATQAQFLFGMGADQERLLFLVSQGRLSTRRDVGIEDPPESGEVKTGPYEATEETIENEHFTGVERGTRWLQIQEEGGLVRFSVGASEDDLQEVDVQSTPFGLRDPTARGTILVGRWRDEVEPPGQVALGTFCHCPIRPD